MDLDTIFKFTIVASHLCNESKNPNCIETFPKIDLRNHPKISPLYLSITFFWKYCPSTVFFIDLSNNSLKGIFPIDVLFCTQIQSLHLSHIGLTGDVPIENLSRLTNLTVLNILYNRFSEAKISDSRFFKQFDPSCFFQSGIIPSHQKYKIKAVMILISFVGRHFHVHACNAESSHQWILKEEYSGKSDRHMRALVTEWIGQVSVDMWLSETGPSWKHRFKVSVGDLKALWYFQDQWPEIGCDVKTSSVLLHENGEPLIARTLQDEFEGDEAGLIEYVKMVYPGKLQKVIDEKMKLTENTLDQTRQTICIGLMWADHQSCGQLSLGKIYNMIAEVHSRT
ncbi:ankyrin-2-like [Hibiscus syriacus]|uniref:Ankyrin-2-like n=1 Tax=Hibiscus syriacus TaxID=106335 RepID=A0A6A2YC88_HIBSY|nr:ankyrin-2-like [Hibiscus syriacus]